MMTATVPRLYPGAEPFVYTEEEVRNAIQFFRADWPTMMRYGGPFYKRLREYLAYWVIPENDHDHVVADTRVHMLMPGMYPCIPGWHCDDFYRPVQGGQPDLINAPRAWHTALVLDCGSGSLTEFIDENLTLPVNQPERGKTLYGTYDRIIEARRPLRILTAPSGVAVHFDQHTWHRGMPATSRGWRMFLRMTQSAHLTPRNEIRSQTQVYLTQTNGGW